MNSAGPGSVVANWGNCSAPTEFSKSAPPSVEVHGGVSSEGAAIFGIQASEAADEFSGTRIRGCELGELQRPYRVPEKRTALG